MKMAWATLSRRLSMVFAVLLLACCGASAWLQMRSNGLHEQEVTSGCRAGLRPTSRRTPNSSSPAASTRTR
jgi:hypothetical protein